MESNRSKYLKKKSLAYAQADTSNSQVVTYEEDMQYKTILQWEKKFSKKENS